MALEGVPWFVGGGAAVSAEAARREAYVAHNGNEGVLNPTDLKVTAYTTPGAGVTVGTGAFSVVNRATAQPNQCYSGAMVTSENTPVAANGASGIRRDLVVLRIEDPWLPGEPWADPANPAVGPYNHVRVISGVPSTVIASHKAARDYLRAAGFTAIPLAGITLPINTAAVQASHINDLRKVANPRRQFEREHMSSTTNDTVNAAYPAYEQFPNGVALAVEVPEWAVVCKVLGYVEGLKLLKAGSGGMRIGIVGQATLATRYTDINEPAPSGNMDRRSYALGGSIAIPANLRGTTQTFEVQGTYTTGVANSNGFLTTDPNSSGLIDLIFEEREA